MTMNASTRQRDLGDANHGLRDLCVALILASGWIPVAIAGIHSAFAMAWATGLTICAAPAAQAFDHEQRKWSGFIVWVVRLGAVLSGWWLLHSSGLRALGIAALCTFALLYLTCDCVAIWKIRRSPTATA
jgi:hypothetical protein